ncbi:MAG: hypothetical protein J6A21_11105 [Lentisphaeria bacterium]|nr:hypothetical protein [Lentisphaeria bacterium]
MGKRSIFFLILFLAGACALLSWGFSTRCKCGTFFGRWRCSLKEGRVLRVSIGKRITSLDPALASDSYSQKLVSAIFDTPLQYAYTQKKPVRLEEGMLEKMPEFSPDGKKILLTLRKGLFFHEDKCFPDGKSRKVTAEDLRFSILRLADPRLMSGGYWLVRGKIEGLEKFRKAAEKSPPGDFSAYKEDVDGLKVLDEHTLQITLKNPDPRFIYALAMPFFSVVSERCARFYGEEFADHPVGSGPFVMKEWTKDHRMILKRFSGYRKEFYKDAANAFCRKKPLPFLDRVECYFVRQDLASWLMFLQGKLDYCSLEGEKFDAVSDSSGNLIPALRKRGMRLLSAPFFEVNYIGFHFGDPRLAGNRKLRQALSLAFDKEFRKVSSNGRLMKIYSPVPSGVAGALEGEKGPYGEKDLVRAKRLLAEAGYPEGIDPATGKNLVFTFDQAGGDTFFRQTAEMLASDMKKIGVTIVPVFNNRARFFQRLRQDQAQLFRLSWVGDYPDAENFFQLFYGENAGSCNRAGYRNKRFDAMYEEIRGLPDSPQRTQKYEKMTRFLMEECPWIFESRPVAFILVHPWVENLFHHDFVFSSWKYLNVDPARRDAERSRFRPIPMSELRK